jgi:hypothetical protein
MSKLPRIRAIKVEKPFTLRVQWQDGTADLVDMTGAIAGFEPFAPLKDRGLFDRAKVIERGTGIEWPNGLDFSAGSLAHIAAEQKKMTGEDFKRWQSDMSLSLQETADALGVTASTVKNYRNADEIPVTVQLACRAIARDKETFFARYRPRVTGRPRAEQPRTISRTRLPERGREG